MSCACRYPDRRVAFHFILFSIPSLQCVHMIKYEMKPSVGDIAARNTKASDGDLDNGELSAQIEAQKIGQQRNWWIDTPNTSRLIATSSRVDFGQNK